MKHYIIKRICNLFDWQDIPVLSIDCQPWGNSTDIKAWAQICYNDAGLFVHMWAKEKDVRAELTRPLSMVCQDSCLEFFFCPDENDARYVNFEINPNCCTFIGVSHCRSQSIRLCPENEAVLFNKHSNYTAIGWEVSYTIPLSFLNVLFPACKFYSGAIIKANCYKCGDKTTVPHYFSWNPVQNEVPDFHRPQDFGEMILE